MSRNLRSNLPAALACIGLAAFAAAAASAAVYIPTKTADSAGLTCDPSDCSLREAILAANANPGDDVILLHAGVYILTISGNEDLGAAGDLDIQGDLVLIGDGAGRTIVDGNGIDRIFDIPGGVTADISDLTLRNGRVAASGGAVLNQGRLTLTRALLAGNSASGDGGAIATNGSNSELHLSASTIASNTSQAKGGAIAVGGMVEIANVTISGNQANLGGGLYVFSDARATANNLTIAGNNAASQGGGVLAESSAFIGIPPTITNSILAGNSARTDPDCSGPVNSAYDLFGAATAGCVLPLTGSHDLIGVELRLGPLAENGGPTPTRALLAGSPAIDAASPAPPGSADACVATDQRGAARPGGLRCDIGAAEQTTACVAGGDILCLAGGRFQVTARWQTANADGPAHAELANPITGLFSFFDPDNTELTVKVLNTCSTLGRYGFFASGTTSLRVDLTVTDTKTGVTRTYINPRGRVFRSILDNKAFNTCP
jgi:CSLREA domain-containing protein